MVAHVVVAQQRRDVADEALPRGYVVADEGVEGVDGTEGVVGIVLVEILSLDVPSAGVPVETCVIHHDVDVVGLDFLRAQHETETVGQQQLRLGREVDAVGPEVLLIGQS